MTKEQSDAVIMLVVIAVVVTAVFAAYIALGAYTDILVYAAGAIIGACIRGYVKVLWK